MSRRLPPLAWLRAFEAAARHESFRAAAAELSVTPSAISHHVRALERYLGRPLFQRTANRVRLTSEGGAYLERIAAGFAQLAAAAEAFEAAAGRPRLVIGAFPFLVSEVLLPNLPALQQQLADVDIAVVSGTALELLTHADPGRRVDALVRYGSGRFPGCLGRRLTSVRLVPVAAPGFHGGADAIELGPRITVAGPFDGWRVWAEGAGAELGAATTLSFDNYLSAMRAAEQGLGVGLGIRPFVDGWLAAGRLVALAGPPVAVRDGSYLVVPAHAEGRRDLEVLAGWLRECLGQGEARSPQA